MQVNVNQDTAIRQYTQNVQSAKAVTAPVTATKEEASADAVQRMWTARSSARILQLPVNE